MRHNARSTHSLQIRLPLPAHRQTGKSNRQDKINLATKSFCIRSNKVKKQTYITRRTSNQFLSIETIRL